VDSVLYVDALDMSKSYAVTGKLGEKVFA